VSDTAPEVPKWHADFDTPAMRRERVQHLHELTGGLIDMWLRRHWWVRRWRRDGLRRDFVAAMHPYLDESYAASARSYSERFEHTLDIARDRALDEVVAELHAAGLHGAIRRVQVVQRRARPW